MGIYLDPGNKGFQEILKWNKSSEGANNCSAIRQIKERHYPAVLRDYGGEVIIVGISYDAKKKEHSCGTSFFHSGSRHTMECYQNMIYVMIPEGEPSI